MYNTARQPNLFRQFAVMPKFIRNGIAFMLRGFTIQPKTGGES